MNDANFYAYILMCADRTYYTGYTNDLEKRLRTHNQGKGARYTRYRGPVELVYWESFPTKSEAMRREYAIKQLSRDEKKQLIAVGQRTHSLDLSNASAMDYPASRES